MSGTKYSVVYNSAYDILGEISRHITTLDNEEWYLISWGNGHFSWLCNSRDFVREDVFFMEEIEEKKRLALLLRI
jgi:hypothetical protein